jgi:hypothetical protein
MFERLGKKVNSIDEWLICREMHKDGNFHIHAAIKIKRRIRFKPRIFDLTDYAGRVHSGHYERIKNWKAALRYLIKEGDFITNTSVNCPVIKSKSYNKINNLLLNSDLHKLVLDGSISLSQFNSLSKAKLTFISTNPDREKITKRKCFWIYGDPGIGKSYLVRQVFSSLYVKPIGKWWDGYNMEKVVLMEDFDKDTCTLQELKLWADQYSDINCEIKGGMCKPIYKVLIITSNYSIDYCFPFKDDSAANEAITRRFKEIKYKNRNQYDEIAKELSQSLEDDYHIENNIDQIDGFNGQVNNDAVQINNDDEQSDDGNSRIFGDNARSEDDNSEINI